METLAARRLLDAARSCLDPYGGKTLTPTATLADLDTTRTAVADLMRIATWIADLTGAGRRHALAAADAALSHLHGDALRVHLTDTATDWHRAQAHLDTAAVALNHATVDLAHATDQLSSLGRVSTRRPARRGDAQALAECLAAVRELTTVDYRRSLNTAADISAAAHALADLVLCVHGASMTQLLGLQYQHGELGDIRDALPARTATNAHSALTAAEIRLSSGYSALREAYIALLDATEHTRALCSALTRLGGDPYEPLHPGTEA